MMVIFSAMANASLPCNHDFILWAHNGSPMPLDGLDWNSWTDYGPPGEDVCRCELPFYCRPTATYTMWWVMSYCGLKRRLERSWLDALSSLVVKTRHRWHLIRTRGPLGRIMSLQCTHIASLWNMAKCLWSVFQCTYLLIPGLFPVTS